MGRIDVVTEWIRRAEAKDWDGATAMMTDDCVFAGPVPEPISGAEFIALMQAMTSGMPDWTYGFEVASEDGDDVVGTVQVGGTHTATLSLPFMGIPDVPATGKAVRNPKEPIRLTMRDDKIAAITVDATPGAGVAGILQQLGVELPA